MHGPARGNVVGFGLSAILGCETPCTARKGGLPPAHGTGNIRRCREIPAPFGTALSLSGDFEDEMQARLHSSSPTEASDGSKPAILLVEDEPTTRLVCASLLRRTGHEVEVVENGLQALERLRERLFPILLTDWEMPVMDGVELCRAVRAAQFNGYVYTILLTARDSKANIIEGLEAGADDYLTKPVSDQELAARLKTAGRILRLERSLRAANERNLQLSVTDCLTGAYNRRHLMEQLPREIERARRYTHPLSIVLCDIDYFKKINDSHGHQAGDEVLVQFAALLRRSSRDELDWIVRYGGEEFLVVLPETDFEAALAFAERIRCELETKGVPAGRDRLPVTASFGVVTDDGVAGPAGIDAEALIGSADACLYRSKQVSRNRVTGKSFDFGARTIVVDRPAAS